MRIKNVIFLYNPRMSNDRANWTKMFTWPVSKNMSQS